MKRAFALLACAAFVELLSVSPATAQSPSWLESIRDHVDFDATLELEWSLGLSRGRTQKAELVFTPEIDVELPLGMDLTSIWRLRSDAFDRLEPGQPTAHEVSSHSRYRWIGNQTQVELREFYVEATVGRTFLTLGKQQIVWGKADELKILDVVNPQSFREFILDDFEDSRIPLWAVNAEIPIRDLVLQLIWLPDASAHDLPPTGSLYEFTTELLLPLPIAGIPVLQLQADRPTRFFADSDAGMRISTFWKGWDLTVNYLYHYFDSPVLFRKIPTVPMLLAGAPVTIQPEYRRSHLIGGTFSNAFGDLTVRGEIGYETDRYISLNDASDGDGVAETGELSYVLGLDWYGFDESLVSFQIFQSWIPEHKNLMVRKEIETNFSLLLRREFMNDTVTLDLVVVQAWSKGDGMVRPSVRYELRDGIELFFGFDFFYGDDAGLFGQYDERDRANFRIKWSL